MFNRRMPRGYPRQPLPFIGPWPTTPRKRRTRRIITWLGASLALALLLFTLAARSVHAGTAPAGAMHVSNSGPAR
jgi:hypothetical protein